MAPKETENNAYAKFWGAKQRALWYVMVFSGVVNCDALQILLFLLCDESSILVKQRVVIVVHCYSCVKQFQR